MDLRIVINQAKLDALVATSSREAVEKACQRTEERVKRNIVAGDHIVTGALLNSIHHYIEKSDGQGSSGFVGSPLKQAGFLERGRGPVRPVRARILAFTTKGGSQVFTHYSGPAEATHFLSSTLTMLTVADFT